MILMKLGHVPTTTFPPPLEKQLLEITASARVRDLFPCGARYIIKFKQSLRFVRQIHAAKRRARDCLNQ